MLKLSNVYKIVAVCVFGLIVMRLSASVEAKPLKVFILAGQSNMEGHAKVETFDYIGDDPATASLLEVMRDESGKPRVSDHTWISYYTGRGDNNGEGYGKLTAGYGSRPNPVEDGGKIGPEFTFGLYIEKAIKEPILIIKTAWGGKSLFLDFRPPSAGPYVKTAKDIEKKKVITEEMTGHYYRLMLEHVRYVLKDIKRVVPGYDPTQGYELSGFVWFQGFNDMVNRDVYPRDNLPAGQNIYAKYSVWMADFIRDVRKDLGVNDLPFVIGQMGVGGMNGTDHNLQFAQAMGAPAKLTEFKGNVGAVPTAPYWDEPLAAISAKRDKVRGVRSKLNKKVQAGEITRKQMDAEVAVFEKATITADEMALFARGASNGGYHYLGCAKTLGLVGKAFATEMIELMKTAK